ncbi:hypothetical protein D3C72_2508320 [compost metagenome]
MHLGGAQPLGIKHDSQRIALVSMAGEHIGGDIAVAHGSILISRREVAAKRKLC